MKLDGKKVIALGERDGVPGPAIADCVRTAGADVIFVETEQRAAFKPIKIPVRYQLVNDEGGRLEGIDVVAPASRVLVSCPFNLFERVRWVPSRDVAVWNLKRL